MSDITELPFVALFETSLSYLWYYIWIHLETNSQMHAIDITIVQAIIIIIMKTINCFCLQRRHMLFANVWHYNWERNNITEHCHFYDCSLRYQTNERTNKQINKRTNEQTNKQSKERTNKNIRRILLHIFYF